MPFANHYNDFMSIDAFSVIYILIALLCLLSGFAKGFKKTLIGLLVLVLAFFASYLLAKPFAEWLISTDWGVQLTEGLTNYIAEKESLALVPQPGDTFKEALPLFYESIGIPEFFYGLMNSLVNPYITAVTVPAVALGSAMAYGALIAFSYFIVFVVAFVVFEIIGLIVRIITKKRKKGLVSRLGGMLLGAAVAFVILVSFTFGLSAFLASGTDFAQSCANHIGLNDDNVSNLTKWFLSQEWIYSIFQYFGF